MTAYHASPIGLLGIDTDGTHITAIRIVSSRDDTGSNDIPIIRAAKDWLDGYFSGGRPDPGLLPLAPKGTNFQQLIWWMLLQIPYGKTVTYGGLAKRAAHILGRSQMSAQAVGNAVSKNPILIVIPCHRVLGANNALTGFSAGIDKKIQLLRSEGIDLIL